MVIIYNRGIERDIDVKKIFVYLQYWPFNLLRSVERVTTELQINLFSCQTLGPARPTFFFRNFLIFHFQYSMIKGTILNKGNSKITELRTILQRESQNS